MTNLIPIILIAIAYLMGSIASAILVCKLFGLADPRSEGSGNPGATNVMRLHGKKAAILTLAGDVLKGVIPVLLAKVLGSSEFMITLCGLAAFLGHLFPIFFSFKGGKGVATLIGVLVCDTLVTGSCLYWHLGAFRSLISLLFTFSTNCSSANTSLFLANFAKYQRLHMS